VMIHHRASQGDAKQLVAALNAARANSAASVRADLLNLSAVAEVVRTTVERFGGLDVLVNNASTFFPTPVGEIKSTDWDNLIGTNLKGPLFLAQAAAPHLAKSRGCIVNITDIHADRPLKRYVVYSVAKAGLAGLTKSLARELGPDVRVNAVAPGPILWPDDGSYDEVARQRVVSHTLLKRTGEPEDIAKAVYFLVAEAPYVTGQIVAVDGGRSINL
jgi:pteridine reductase